MSSSFDMTGRLVAKMDIVERPSKSGGDPFRTREFVIEVGNDIGGRIITNYIKFQSVMDKTTLIDNFQIGDMLKVNFNIKGSKYVNRTTGQDGYITNLDAWKIEKSELNSAHPSSAPQQGYSNNSMPSRTATDNSSFQGSDHADSDDLPF